ncbi:hypothetical protein ACF08N_36620 [Streptomyces sp. NPDC015127]|uniref:hypothetical protein n=1 Tax=Streptomyces sp. NPDC015127 TaxID=3364939 RepID=UPI0036FCBEB5
MGTAYSFFRLLLPLGLFPQLQRLQTRRRVSLMNSGVPLRGKITTSITVGLIAIAALPLSASPAAAAGGARFEEFKAYAATSEEGGDSPYFAVFIGRPNGTSEVTLIRKSWWDNNVDDDYRSVPQHLITSYTPNGSLIVVTLIEEDVDPDLGSAQVTSLREAMGNYWEDFHQSSPQERVSKMKYAMNAGIGARLGNDDLLATDAEWVNTQSGWLPAFEFNNNNAFLYKAWIRIV